jgi:hypothetical protein
MFKCRRVPTYQVWVPQFKPQYPFPKKRKKIQQELGMVAQTCNPSTTEAEAGESQVWGHPGLHNYTLSQKQSQADDLVQVVTHLPSKCEALSSNPSTTNKTKVNKNKGKISINRNRWKLPQHNKSHMKKSQQISYLVVKDLKVFLQNQE